LSRKKNKNGGYQQKNFTKPIVQAFLQFDVAVADFLLHWLVGQLVSESSHNVFLLMMDSTSSWKGNSSTDNGDILSLATAFERHREMNDGVIGRVGWCLFLPNSVHAHDKAVTGQKMEWWAVVITKTERPSFLLIEGSPHSKS
jgi:hypothetical protein